MSKQRKAAPENVAVRQAPHSKLKDAQDLMGNEFVQQSVRRFGKTVPGAEGGITPDDPMPEMTGGVAKGWVPAAPSPLAKKHPWTAGKTYHRK